MTFVYQHQIANVPDKSVNFNCSQTQQKHTTPNIHFCSFRNSIPPLFWSDGMRMKCARTASCILKFSTTDSSRLIVTSIYVGANFTKQFTDGLVCCCLFVYEKMSTASVLPRRAVFINHLARARVNEI